MDNSEKCVVFVNGSEKKSVLKMKQKLYFVRLNVFDSFHSFIDKYRLNSAFRNSNRTIISDHF